MRKSLSGRPGGREGGPAVKRVLESVLLVSVMLIGACGDPGGVAEAPAALVSGEYRAQGALGAFRLITTGPDGEETDWLARGGSVELRLAADGGTSGRLFVPGGDEDGGNLDSDLAGTFSVLDGVVTFDHESDTFIRDMPFAWTDGRLRGDRVFDETRVILELVRR